MSTAKSTVPASRFHHPFLAGADVMRLAFVERYTGTSNYQRSAHTHALASSSYTDNLWREPVPLNISSTYGVAITVVRLSPVAVHSQQRMGEATAAARWWI